MTMHEDWVEKSRAGFCPTLVCFVLLLPKQIEAFVLAADLFGYTVCVLKVCTGEMDTGI